MLNSGINNNNAVTAPNAVRSREWPFVSREWPEDGMVRPGEPMSVPTPAEDHREFLNHEKQRPRRPISTLEKVQYESDVYDYDDQESREQLYRDMEDAQKEAAEGALAGERSTPDDYFYCKYDNAKPRTHISANKGVREPWAPEDSDRIREAYEDNVAERMTQAAANIIEHAYQEGLEVEEIIMAIEETGLAPSPSPYYLRAILRNWLVNGRITSRARHYSEGHKARRIAWWKPEVKRRHE